MQITDRESLSKSIRVKDVTIETNKLTEKQEDKKVVNNA